MNDLRQEVKNLLFKHDYITKIQKSGDGCIITYPHPKLLTDAPRLVEAFVFERGPKSGLWASLSTDEKGQKERFFEIPEYALRLYIICEIAACNSRIPIEPSLMVFLNDDDEEGDDIDFVIDSPESEEDRKREAFLYRLVIEARNDGFPPNYEEVAETHGVGHGYSLIRKFYE